jgi:S1-C subfamily serine protease
MKATDRPRRSGLATGMAAVLAAMLAGGVTACATTAAAPAVSPAPAVSQAPAAAVTGEAARPAGGGAVASYAAAVRAVLPSVVLVRTASGLGSGVVLDRAGNIITNAHVAGQATALQIQRAGDPAPRPAHLVGSYPGGDLAVIRAENPAGLAPARFGDSGKAQAGDVVLAVGNPLGLAGSVTEGIISATGRAVVEPATASTTTAAALPDAIQTSAPINPGNSGGALVTTSGQVIGIPTLAAVSPQGGGQAQGIGFAIPANLARDIAGQIISTGHVTNTHRAALGARIGTASGPDGTPQGAAVAGVTPGGPAERAGLRAGDIIRKLGPVPTPDAGTLLQALAAADPGQRVEVTIVRAGQAHTVPVTLGTLPAG